MAARRPRRSNKRKQQRNPNKITRLPGTLAPQHMLVKLKYLNSYQKSPPTGGVIASYNQFRLNSIFDPDYTNTTGTSCLGLSQWGALYMRYRVYKVAYTIRLSNMSSDAVVSGAVIPSNYLDNTASISDYMRPLARRFELGNKEGSNKAVIKGLVHLPKLAGLTPTQYKSDPRNEALFTANPQNFNTLNILVQSTNVGIQPSIGAQVEFTYFVELMSTQATAEALDHATGLSVVPVERYCT